MDSRPSQKPLSWWMYRWKHWRLQNSTALKKNQKTKSRNTNHLNQEVMRPNETNPTGEGMKPPWATQNQVRPQRYRRTKRRAAGDEMNQDPRRQPKTLVKEKPNPNQRRTNPAKIWTLEEDPDKRWCGGPTPHLAPPPTTATWWRGRCLDVRERGGG
jgi:hypothetical protein